MAGWQRGQTHCKHGHAFTSDNTKVRKDGVRICLTCVSVRSAKCYANQPQEPQRKENAQIGPSALRFDIVRIRRNVA